jgi:hypothetical protein
MTTRRRAACFPRAFHASCIILRTAEAEKKGKSFIITAYYGPAILLQASQSDKQCNKKPGIRHFAAVMIYLGRAWRLFSDRLISLCI